MGTTPKSHDVALVRIVGNELPPRHALDSNLEQLRFILENEPTHPRMKKIWLLNRLVDHAQEKAMIDILEAHGCSYVVLPFDMAEYKDYLQRGAYKQTSWYRRSRKELLAKAGFIIEINRARNKAMEAGLTHADWVLPLDGGCCLDAKGMASLFERMASPKRDAYALPTYRLVSNQNYADFSPAEHPMHESMLLLRGSLATVFDESIPYGKGEKLETIFRLFPRSAMRRTAYAYLIDDPDYHAGYVVRLSSGNDEAEGKYRRRVKLRFEGLAGLVDKLDAQIS